VALAMLAEGRADCVAYDDITLRYLTARRPELGVGSTFDPPGGAAVYGFGFASGVSAESFKDALAALRENGAWRRAAEPFGFTEPNVLPDEDVDRTCEK
jgi:ABC-type amino acid transport substrate-binding protein